MIFLSIDWALWSLISIFTVQNVYVENNIGYCYECKYQIMAPWFEQSLIVGLQLKKYLFPLIWVKNLISTRLLVCKYLNYFTLPGIYQYSCSSDDTQQIEEIEEVCPNKASVCNNHTAYYIWWPHEKSLEVVEVAAQQAKVKRWWKWIWICSKLVQTSQNMFHLHICTFWFSFEPSRECWACDFCHWFKTSWHDLNWAKCL